MLIQGTGTGLVMQKLKELESNARPPVATGSRGAAINPHCAKKEVEKQCQYNWQQLAPEEPQVPGS